MAIFTFESTASDFARAHTPSRLSIWRSMPPSVSRSSHVPRTTRITGEPSALAARMASARCSSAVPRFGLKAFEVGHTLHVPSCTRRNFDVAFSRTAARYPSSSDSKASRSVMNSVLQPSDAA